MTTIHKIAMASAVAIAFATFAGSPAQAGPNVPAGHYCMVDSRRLGLQLHQLRGMPGDRVGRRRGVLRQERSL